MLFHQRTTLAPPSQFVTDRAVTSGGSSIDGMADCARGKPNRTHCRPWLVPSSTRRSPRYRAVPQWHWMYHGDGWRPIADSTAAGGIRAYDPNLGRPKVAAPVPIVGTSTVTLPFRADPRLSYKLWIRLRADGFLDERLRLGPVPRRDRRSGQSEVQHGLHIRPRGEPRRVFRLW